VKLGKLATAIGLKTIRHLGYKSKAASSKRADRLTD
jgi:hypothetical protein